MTVDAANEIDAMRALGYVHAQERFFEMDLMRRSAAGELAELFGPIAVDTDRQHRVHRMRARATQDLPAIAGDKLGCCRPIGRRQRRTARHSRSAPGLTCCCASEPRRWQPADTPLVGYAMYFDLQDASNKRALALWRLQQALPPPLYALLSHDGTPWDAPLIGQPRATRCCPAAAPSTCGRCRCPRCHAHWPMRSFRRVKSAATTSLYPER